MNKENNHCNKYEGLFVFSDDETFNEHIKHCKDCQIEHNKYLKISSLVKEVKPVYIEREKKKNMINAAKRLACCFVIFIGIAAFACYNLYSDYEYQLSIEQESAISEMGLPIDKYGFLSL